MLETTNKIFENCSVGVKVSTILFHGIDSGALPLSATKLTLNELGLFMYYFCNEKKNTYRLNLF